jgi:hypothetical protein
MEHKQLDTVLNEMPNQEEFKNLAVNPADICSRSSSWEASKRFKVPLSDQYTLKQPMEIFNCSEHEICSEKVATTTTADRDRQNQTGALAASPDDECEIITFIIGAASIRDTSTPMPPPARFVRKGSTL